MLRNIIEKIRDRVKQRLVISYLFERLNAIGITIKAYYLAQESVFDKSDLNLKPKLDPLRTDFLSPSEIISIYDHPESKQLGRDNKRLVEEGYRCFGSRYNDGIVTYLWLNLYQCHEVYPFLLQEDEAYLTRVFTFRVYRGRNLALFLRHQLYKYLRHIGRTRVYSLIDLFNTPAIKLNRKLKANPLKIIISIKLFNKYDWNIVTGSPKHFVIPF
jgi:hypothetical protein